MKTHKNATLFGTSDASQKLVKNEFYSELFNVDLYREIIESSIFKRLQKIHFLGAIDYIYKNKKKHTRYEHTLSVTSLALQYSYLTNLTFDEQKYLVCAALLHDIGHGPLSHSMEPSFKKLFNITHHTAGINIINGTSPLGREITSILNKYKIDIDKIIKLLNGKSAEKYALALDNPINIDTIDGIIRSYTYLVNSRNIYKGLALLPSTTDVLEATLNSSKQNILDIFWTLKDKVYSALINDRLHIYADNYSQKFILKEKKVKKSDFYLSEIEFKESYRSLFDDLGLLKEIRENDKSKYELFYTERSYKIEHNIKASDISEYENKYIHTKISKVYVLNSNYKTHQQLF